MRLTFRGPTVTQTIQQEDEMAKVATLRDGIAARIRELSQRWAENTIALGREFIRARDSFPIVGPNHRPGWREWISKETGWSADHAITFVRIADKFGRGASTIKLSHEVMRFISSSKTPADGADEVIRRAKKGEVIGLDKAKEIVKPFLPTRSQAIKEAAETGRLIAARDGKLYSGASEDQMAAYSERREAVYAVRRAVKEIADCEFTPGQWVKAAEAHWLAEFRLADIDAAIKWLTQVRPLVEKRQGVVDG